MENSIDTNENNGLTFGKKGEVHKVEYSMPDNGEAGLFTVYLTVDGSWREIFIEEDELESKVPSIKTHTLTPISESMIDWLSFKWEDLVSICKHERTRQQREHAK